ncbi:MAG: hypothetical protein FWG51_00610 [Firmicutes bacterium]|nr:hypothetical protein [Bacillota bacterium]
MAASVGVVTYAANSGNNGNQSAPISSDAYPLHQGVGPFDWRPYLEGSDFGINEKKGENNYVPGYELGTDGTVLWHFVNPDKLGGYANVTFINEEGKEVTIKVSPYKNDQHFAIVTLQSWKLLSAEYFPATAPKKGATQFNLSHTAGKIKTISDFGSLTALIDANYQYNLTLKQKTMMRDVWDIMEREVWDVMQREIWDIMERETWDIMEREIWDIMQRKITSIMERETWDIMEREIWDIMQRETWDIIQREVTDIMQREIWDIMQREIQPYLVPAFEKKISSGGKDTLTSYRNNGTIPGGSFNNGMQYLKIDVLTARERGYTFGIAQSNPANTYVGYDYFVNIVDDKLIVSFDDRFIEAIQATAKVYNTAPSSHDNSGHITLRTGDTLVVDLPKNYGDTVYLYVHFNNGVRWFTTGEYEFVGWRLGGQIEGEYKKVGDGSGEYIKVDERFGEYVKVGEGFGDYVKVDEGFSDYSKVGEGFGDYIKVCENIGKYVKVGEGFGEYVKIGEGFGEYVKIGEDFREYKVYEDFGKYVKIGEKFGEYKLIKIEIISCEIIYLNNFVAEFNLIVSDGNGKAVYNGPIASDANGLTLPNLKSGVYYLVLSGNGVYAEQQITVEANKTAKALFDGIVIIGNDEEEFLDPILIDNPIRFICYRDKVIEPKYLEDIKLDDKLEDKKISPVYEDKKVGNEYLEDKLITKYLDDKKIDDKFEDKVIDPKYLDDKKIDDEYEDIPTDPDYLDDKKVDDKYLTDIIRDPIRLGSELDPYGEYAIRLN